jgi:hypothetical protein
LSPDNLVWRSAVKRRLRRIEAMARSVAEGEVKKE